MPIKLTSTLDLMIKITKVRLNSTEVSDWVELCVNLL